VYYSHTQDDLTLQLLPSAIFKSQDDAAAIGDVRTLQRAEPHVALLEKK